jgi:hypothetical protein
VPDRDTTLTAAYRIDAGPAPAAAPAPTALGGLGAVLGESAFFAPRVTLRRPSRSGARSLGGRLLRSEGFGSWLWQAHLRGPLRRGSYVVSTRAVDSRGKWSPACDPPWCAFAEPRPGPALGTVSACSGRSYWGSPRSPGWPRAGGGGGERARATREGRALTVWILENQPDRVSAARADVARFALRTRFKVKLVPIGDDGRGDLLRARTQPAHQ